MDAKPEPVLIDTSVWIDALRGRTPWVAASVRKLLEDDLAATCGPVLFEIRRGLKPPERKKVLPLFAALHRLPFDESDWESAGELDASLRKAGHSLPSMDVLIARLCLRDKAALFTLDEHFKQVPGLRMARFAS